MHPLQQWMSMASKGCLQQNQTLLGDKVHSRLTYMFLNINFAGSLQSGFDSNCFHCFPFSPDEPKHSHQELGHKH